MPTEASVLSRHSRPATLQDALEQASRLRVEDRRELEGSGWNPVLALYFSVAHSTDPLVYITRSGSVGGFAGVVDEGQGIGRVWLLCTDAVRENPVTFYRAAKEWLASLNYTMLHNVADPRNKLHLKLLHKLGFKKLSFVTVGPEKRTYVEFAKLCAPLSQSALQVP